MGKLVQSCDVQPDILARIGTLLEGGEGRRRINNLSSMGI